MRSSRLEFVKSIEDAASRFLLALAAIFLAAAFLSAPAFSQLNLGRILGAITDPSGATIGGATVTVIDVQRNVSRPLTADAAGEYSAPSLTPGTYTIRAEFKGFQTTERAGVVVGVGQDVRVDITLQPGAQTQTVVVTGEAPLINTTNAQLGGTVENQEINEIPLNGRQFRNLLSFKPGITANPGTGNNKSFESNGNRPEGTVYMLDGLYDNNIFSGMPIVGGSTSGGGPDQATILPLDAIQEINVIENPKAEYGWRPGAQVNVGLKSGTNSIHGTAFAFGRDAALDARDFFLPATLPKAPLNFEQFGASVGGPIKKDKLFYFGDYEGQRLLAGAPIVFQVPTSTAGASKTDSFPDAIADLKAHGLTPSQLSLNLAGCNLAGSCNAANGVFGNSNATQVYPTDFNLSGGSNNALAKIDYHLNEHNSLNGEYFFGQSTFIYPHLAIQPYWFTSLYARAQMVRGVWVWTPNSNLVNEARFGYDNTSLPNNNTECTDPSSAPNYQQLYGFVSGAQFCGFPQLTISGFEILGGSANPQTNHFGVYAGSDTVSYTHGKHLFKFGGEIHHNAWCCAQTSSGTGTLQFAATTINGVSVTPLEAFLMGVQQSTATQILIGNPNRNISSKAFALFFQDDYRLTPRLTLSIGLRWEYEAPIREANNLLGNFSPSAPAGLIQESGGNTVYSGDFKDFGPRLGVAWDVTGKGTTVVRAGGGLVSNYCCNIQSLVGLGGSTASLNAVPTGFTLFAANGSTVPSPGTITAGLANEPITWALNTPIFNTTSSALRCGNGLGSANTTGVVGTANPANPGPCNLGAVNPNMDRGYVTTWTLGVQHAFKSNVTMDVAYVGNHGTKLNGPTDINAPALGQKITSITAATGAVLTEQMRRPYYSQFPYLGKIIYWTDGYESNYNGLQASLTQRNFHGMTFVAGYTYAHALDQASSESQNSVFGLMNPLNPKADYGDSSFDVHHNFTLAASYLIPGKKSPGQVLDGWQLNAAVNVMSAFPWTAVDTSNDLSGTGRLLDRWTLIGNPADFTNVGDPVGAKAGLIPCYGVGTAGFGGTAGCTSEPTVSAMPPACIAAATAEATNPNVPASDANSTGLKALANIGCYAQGSAAMVPPAQGTYGTMGRNVLRGRGFQGFDMSIAKNWKFKERLTAQFRAEFFNVLNHPQFVTGSVIGNGSYVGLQTPSSFGQATASPNTGNSVIGSGGPRAIQLGLKLSF